MSPCSSLCGERSSDRHNKFSALCGIGAGIQKETKFPDGHGDVVQGSLVVQRGLWEVICRPRSNASGATPAKSEGLASQAELCVPGSKEKGQCGGEESGSETERCVQLVCLLLQGGPGWHFGQVTSSLCGTTSGLCALNSNSK